MEGENRSDERSEGAPEKATVRRSREEKEKKKQKAK